MNQANSRLTDDKATAISSPPSPTIAKQLAIVRRRLLAERIVALFPWIATITFVVAAGLITVDKFHPFGLQPAIVFGVALATSLLVTFCAAALTNRSELAAALELDRRCKLDERVSSALALRSSAAGAARELNAAEVAVRRAVEADAESAVARVDVRRSFPIVASRKLAWPLVPMAVAVGLALWLAPAVPPVAPVAAATPQQQAQIKESAKTLEKKLAEKKSEAEKLKLVEAQQLLEKLQEEARKLKAAEQIDRKETLVKLNDLAKQVQERRSEVSKADEMKKQLSRLRSKNPGTSEKLTQALTDGKFREAAEQLEQLRKELESGKLDPKQKEQMREQLQRLQKQVEQLAKAQEERRKEAERQSAEKKNQSGESKEGKSGDGKQAGGGEQTASKPGSQSGAMDESALAEQLSKMASQQQSLESLQKALEQASQGMQQGDGSDASKALGDLQQQLDQLSKQASEGELLDRGMQDLAEYKSSLSEGQTGEQHAGNGNAQPGQNGGGGQPGGDQPGNGAQGQGQGRVGQGNGNGGGQGNQAGGSGVGQGVGTRLDAEGSGLTGTFDTRVKQQVSSGALRVVGPTDGPNAKGKALEAIRDQAQAVASGGEAQTLESQALDRSRREQKKQYFDALHKAD